MIVLNLFNFFFHRKSVVCQINTFNSIQLQQPKYLNHHYITDSNNYFFFSSCIHSPGKIKDMDVTVKPSPADKLMKIILLLLVLLVLLAVAVAALAVFGRSILL